MGGRDWDGEKDGSGTGPGGPTSGLVGEAERLSASAMESADPSERERAELRGEAASGDEVRPAGGAGSRLSWTVGGRGAGSTGGGGAPGAGVVGIAAEGWALIRRSREGFGSGLAGAALGGSRRGEDCRLASSRRLMPETVTSGGGRGAGRRPCSDVGGVGGAAGVRGREASAGSVAGFKGGRRTGASSMTRRSSSLSSQKPGRGRSVVDC